MTRSHGWRVIVMNEEKKEEGKKKGLGVAELTVSFLWHVLHRYGGGVSYTAQQLQAMNSAGPVTLPIHIPEHLQRATFRDLVGDNNLATMSPVLDAARKTAAPGSVAPDAPAVAPEGEVAIVTRCCLHSNKLSLVHPSTAEQMTLEAEMPDDYVAVLKALREVA